MPDRRRTRYRRGNGRLLAAAVSCVVAVVGHRDRALRHRARTSTASSPRIGSPGSSDRGSRSRARSLPSVPGRVMTLRGLADGAVSLTANGEPVDSTAAAGSPCTSRRPGPRSGSSPPTPPASDSEVVVPITPNPAQAKHPAHRRRARERRRVGRSGGPRPDRRDDQAGQINAVQLDIKDDDRRDRLRQQGPDWRTAVGAVTGLLRRPGGDRRAARARRAGHRADRQLPRPAPRQLGVGERPAGDDRARRRAAASRSPTTTAPPRSPTSPTRRSASTRSTWPARPSASASTRSSTTTSADPKVIST